MGKSSIFVVAFVTIFGIALAGGRESVPQAKVVTNEYGLRELRIPRSGDGHFYVHASVNGELVRFLVDTGATGIALTKRDAARAGEKFSESDFEVVGVGASGPLRGQMLEIDRVELGGREVTNLQGAVIEGLDISLLGQAFLSRTRSVRMVGDEMVIT